MLPLDESNVVATEDEKLLQNVIATMLNLVVVSWSSVMAKSEVSISASEPDIAGCLVKEMTEEKGRRFGRNTQFRIEEEVGTRSPAARSKPDGRIDMKIIYSFIESQYLG